MNSLFEHFGGSVDLQRRYTRIVAKGLVHGIREKKISLILNINKTIPLSVKKPVFKYNMSILVEVILLFTEKGIRILKFRKKLN
jgi:hypothetical protein